MNATKQHHPSEKINSYIEDLRDYKEKIKDHISDVTKIPMINEVEGEGIKKRRNGYKIVDSKYNDKLLINMDKLYNNYFVEARLNDDIIYKKQGDKNTVELLTKGRINKKKKYSKLAQQIFNDMITLSGFIKKKKWKKKVNRSKQYYFKR